MVNIPQYLEYMAREIFVLGRQFYFTINTPLVNHDEYEYNNYLTWTDTAEKPAWIYFQDPFTITHVDMYFATRVAATEFPAVKTKVDTMTGGSTSQYVRGDGTLATYTGAATRSETSPTRTISNTAFQPSANRDVLATYNISTSTTSTIGGASAITIVAEISPTSGGTYVEKGRVSNSQAITLAIALQSVQASTTPVTIYVPSGYYVKLRQLSASGTSSASVASTQETLL